LTTKSLREDKLQEGEVVRRAHVPVSIKEDRVEAHEAVEVVEAHAQLRLGEHERHIDGADIVGFERHGYRRSLIIGQGMCLEDL